MDQILKKKVNETWRKHGGVMQELLQLITWSPFQMDQREILYVEENPSMLPICHPFPHLRLNSTRMNPFMLAYLPCLEGALYEEYIRSWEDKTTYLPTSESGPVMLVASAAAAIVILPGDSMIRK